MSSEPLNAKPVSLSAVPSPSDTATAKAALHAAESGDPRQMRGFTGGYVRALNWAILRPGATVLLAVALLLSAFGAYG